MTSILIVDDNDTLRESCTRALVHAGYDVHAAADGTAALSHLAKATPDLIITDLVMPEFGGNGLVHLLESWPALAHIPILLVTGNTSAIIPPDHILLEKPFSLSVLITTVQGMLN